MDAIRERYASDAAACRAAIPARFGELDAYLLSLKVDPATLSRTFALKPSESGPVPMNPAVAAALERTQVCVCVPAVGEAHRSSTYRQQHSLGEGRVRRGKIV